MSNAEEAGMDVEPCALPFAANSSIFSVLVAILAVLVAVLRVHVFGNNRVFEPG